MTLVCTDLEPGTSPDFRHSHETGALEDDLCPRGIKGSWFGFFAQIPGSKLCCSKSEWAASQKVEGRGEDKGQSGVAEKRSSPCRVQQPPDTETHTRISGGTRTALYFLKTLITWSWCLLFTDVWGTPSFTGSLSFDRVNFSPIKIECQGIVQTPAPLHMRAKAFHSLTVRT